MIIDYDFLDSAIIFPEVLSTLGLIYLFVVYVFLASVSLSIIGITPISFLVLSNAISECC